MSRPTTILWLRRDLRLGDHPALRAAAERGAVVPVFIWAPDEESPWSPGSATRWWLHGSLAAFEADLRAVGSRLIVRRGGSLDVLRHLVRETGADAVYWGRCYEPALVERDATIKTALRLAGTVAESFNTSLLHEPWTVATKEGKPYKVFTPFWRACLATGEPAEPAEAPTRIPAPATWPGGEPLEALELLPRIAWDRGLREMWSPGERGAQRRLTSFVAEGVDAYLARRDLPAEEGVSLLSPHLHFGEIGPRQLWYAVRRHERAVASTVGLRDDGFLRQLVWREFAHHLLYHFPHTSDAPLRSEFDRFPWLDARPELRAWERGQTGYPLVDAGLRQLWHTGWMHNRVRMIVASFLVKDLLVSWRSGAQWFWDTLVDADLANNTLGWQWTAGCGADAAPFFRVFNPVAQGRKFDPNGAYIRRWVPELAALGDEPIHEPWSASRDVLKAAGVALGQTYPRPLVDHAAARKRALEALTTLR